MKKIILLLILFSPALYAQDKETSLTVKISKEYRDDIATDETLAIHTSNNNVTGVVRSGKKGLLFDIFDTNLSRNFSKLVEIDKKEEFVGELFLNDKLMIFTVFSPQKTERILYCHLLDIATHDYKKVQLFETEVEKGASLFSGKNKRLTNFAASENNKYFAIATDNIKRHSNSYTVRVFNSEDFSLKYTKSYQEDEEKFFIFNDLDIDNNGIAYTIGKLYLDGRKEKKDGEANYQYILNKIDPNKTEFLNIELDNYYIRSLSFSRSGTGLNLLGFYSEKKSLAIKGGCNFVIDTNKLAILEHGKYNLPIEVYEDLYGDKKADKVKDKELGSFDLDYVLTDSDKNTYLLAEQFFVTSQYIMTGNGTGYTVPVYHYDDILILKFKSTGELEWGRSIFKKENIPSYNAFVKNNELHVILNSGKNLKEKKDGRTKVSTGFLEGTSLYDVVFKENGDVSYDKIQDNAKNEYYIPFYGTYENNRLIIMGSGKKKQFMILE